MRLYKDNKEKTVALRLRPTIKDYVEGFHKEWPWSDVSLSDMVGLVFDYHDLIVIEFKEYLRKKFSKKANHQEFEIMKNSRLTVKELEELFDGFISIKWKKSNSITRASLRREFPLPGEKHYKNKPLKD